MPSTSNRARALTVTKALLIADVIVSIGVGARSIRPSLRGRYRPTISSNRDRTGHQRSFRRLRLRTFGKPKRAKPQAAVGGTSAEAVERCRYTSYNGAIGYVIWTPEEHGSPRGSPGRIVLSRPPARPGRSRRHARQRVTQALGLWAGAECVRAVFIATLTGDIADFGLRIAD